MSKRFNGQRRTEDPGDTRAFLRSEGWELVKEENGRERWVGWYEDGDESMLGALVETASGERRYYVRKPTYRFWENAHNGRCQLEESNLVEDAYRLHWNENPDAWVDGIRRIESMM